MDRRDPGNWTGGAVGVGELRGTKYGIAAASHPNVDIANLTPAAAAAIRRSEYWTPAACDALPAGADLVVYDYAINAGLSRSIKALQAVLGLVQDGVIGKVTLTAIEARPGVWLIENLTDNHAAFYRATGDFALYGAEWLARLTRCEKLALSMATGQAASSPVRTAPPRPVALAA